MKTNVVEKVDTKVTVKTPDIYQVTIHNNHTTTMEGVIILLLEVFNMDQEKAIHLMARIHFTGKGVAFEGPRDLAEQIHQLAVNFCKTQPPVLVLQDLVITLDLVP